MGSTTPKSFWTPRWRLLVFLLAASSLGCLMADFYGICSMRFFTVTVFSPAMVVLAALAGFDLVRGDRTLGAAVVLGVTAGLIAAAAYDLFRLPFVFARAWGIASVIPPLNLFKVFPAFGAMILGQPIRQDSYSNAAHLLGWLYHFSNGATIGVMYLALLGDAARRRWSGALLLALGLEVGMLLTPYPRIFQIPLTMRFVLVTLAAHAIFGICLGLSVKALNKRWLALAQANPSIAQRRSAHD